MKILSNTHNNNNNMSLEPIEMKKEIFYIN